MTDPHCIRITNGQRTFYIAGTLENVQLATDKRDALYWEIGPAAILAEHIKSELGWEVTLVSANR